MPTQNRKEYLQYRKYYQRLEPLLTKPKNRIYSTAAFSLLAVSLFGWYAIRPTMQTILFLQREIKDKVVVNQKMEEKITALVEAQARYETVQTKLQLVNQAVPGTPQIIDIVAQLRNLAYLTETSISSIQVPTVPLLGQDATPSGKKAPAEIQSEFPLSIVLLGSYQPLKSFLNGVVGMRRIVSIDSITITPIHQSGQPSSQSGQPSSSQLLQLVLRLKTYYFKE